MKKKISITISDSLLKEIDKCGNVYNFNRSQIISILCSSSLAPQNMIHTNNFIINYKSIIK